MEFIIPRLKIQTLQAQIALRQFVCASLAQEFESKGLTFEQRATLAFRWDDMQKESLVLKLIRDLLERRARANKETTEFGAPAAGLTSLQSDPNHMRSVQMSL